MRALPVQPHLLAVGLTAVVATTFAGCGGGSSGGGFASTAAPVQSAGGAVTTVGPLARARAHHSATTLPDGRILIVGGLVGPTQATAEVEILDPTTGAVSSAAPMRAARMHHAAVLLPTQRVLVIGGQTDRFGPATTATELYDPATNRWTAGPALGVARAGAAVVAYDNGRKVLVAGGHTWANGAPTVHQSAEVYSADANRFTATAAPPRSARTGGVAVDQHNGQLLLASGWASIAQALPARPEVYDVASDQFVPVSAQTERADAAVIQLGLDTHAIGGVTSAAVTLASSEAFDGAAWTAGPAMLEARSAHSATVIATGVPGSNGVTTLQAALEAVVVGGLEGGRYLDTVERFPAAVAPVGSGLRLAEARAHHAAVAVGENVYVIGGVGTGDDLLASIEVVTPGDASSVPGHGAPLGTRTNATTQQPTGALSITALSPTGGPVGTTVEISGSGFDPLRNGNVVRFNGLQAAVQAVDVSQPLHKLTVTVPVGAATGPVTVEVRGVVATGPVFTIGSTVTTGTPPRILFVLPNSAANFIPVSITGQDFGQQPVVTFNGVPTINVLNFSTKALPFIGSVSELIVLVPPGATSGPLVVTSQGQQSNPFYFQVR